MLHIPGLYIAHTDNKGRGVFTAEAVPRDAVIEICHLIFLPVRELELLDQTSLYEYYFEWPGDKRACLALGYGSLYNHSPEPNAEIVFDLETEQIIIKSTQAITAGEEICIHYLGDESQEKPYWF